MPYIKLDRKIVDWEWYQNSNTCRVFLHLLLKANYADKRFEGIVVHRGELVTSYASLAEELELSVRNVRTAITHLKSTGEVTSRIYPKFSVISITNYAMYQDAPTSEVTSNRQATDKQPTTTKEGKNIKKERNNIFAPPTVDEVREYCSGRHNGIDAERFIDYYTSVDWKVGNKKMKDWRAAVRTWERRNNASGQHTGGTQNRTTEWNIVYD